MSQVHELLVGFPIIIEVTVAWGDMDAFGHVNNTIFFRYFESARIRYLNAIEFRGEGGERGVGPILASTQCSFRRPLTYPDTVIVGARIRDLVEDRFTHEYRIISRSLNTVAADGSGVIVAYDYGARRKCAIPPHVRGRIQSLEAGVTNAS